MEKQNNAGRKEKYTTHILPKLIEIEKWITEGEPEYLIADKLGVSKDTWFRYKKEKSEFYDSIKKGQQNLEKFVESQLIKKCKGFFVEEVKTFIEKVESDKNDNEKGNPAKERKKIEKFKKFIPPSDVSIIFALKNLNPSRWKDRQEYKQDINQKIENLIIDIEDDEE